MKTNPLLFIFLGWMLIAFSPALSAEEITVEAEGSARYYTGEEAEAKRNALREAQRNAVNQGAGMLLTSETEVRDFDLVSDRILSKSKGILKNYEILEEGPQGTEYIVRIKATIDTEVLEGDLRTLRTMQELTGRKTIVVFYNSKVQGNLPFNPKNPDDYQVISNAISEVNSVLIERRFDVIDNDLEKVLKDTEDMLLAADADFKEVVSQKAADYGAQYFITFSVVLDIEKGKRINEVRLNWISKLQNTTTGSIVSAKSVTSIKKSREDFARGADYYFAAVNQFRTVARTITSEMADDLTMHLYEWLEDGMPVALRFTGEKSRHASSFLRMLQKVEGVKQVKTINRSGKEMELRIYYTNPDIDTLLNTIEEIFYTNRDFKGFELEVSKMADKIIFSMQREE